jgi:hypothetical protein
LEIAEIAIDWPINPPISNPITRLPDYPIPDVACTYRDLTTLEEFAEVVELERQIWGPGYVEVVPVPILAVSVHRGGILIGAFDGDRMIGFVYSLPSIKDKKPTQWSHMAGVLSEYRSAGLGRDAQGAAARADNGDGARPHRVDLRSAAGDERPPQLRQARRRRRGVRREHLRHVEQPAAPGQPDRSDSWRNGGFASRT